MVHLMEESYHSASVVGDSRTLTLEERDGTGTAREVLTYSQLVLGQSAFCSWTRNGNYQAMWFSKPLPDEPHPRDQFPLEVREFRK